ASQLFTEPDRESHLPEQDLQAAEAEGRAEYERVMVRADHTRFIGRWVTTAIRDDDGQLYGYAKVVRDETERRQTEQRMRASLTERDTLLKEVHHRVKNNLQVIVSLLRLQADQISDPSARSIFDDTQSRVRAIAGIHETLYSSADLAQIDFAQYARGLAEELFGFHNISPDRIQLRINTEDMVLDIGQAIPLGLILNELITNALKHAFGQERTGTVYVTLRYLHDSIRPDQTLDQALSQLTVEDNGAGLPPDFTFENATSMGMYLVRILSRQLRAKLELEQNGRTRFRITFPLDPHPSKDNQ
ncbi:MAG: PAS domain S-box protein, partial [Acidobacteriaceae bacterium]|nr:PAS domain S-box protein [Acidobacteriaceae bacterium]